MADADELKKAWETIEKTIVVGEGEIDETIANMKPEVAERVGPILQCILGILRQIGELSALLRGL